MPETCRRILHRPIPSIAKADKLCLLAQNNPLAPLPSITCSGAHPHKTYPKRNAASWMSDVLLRSVALRCVYKYRNCKAFYLKESEIRLRGCKIHLMIVYCNVLHYDTVPCTTNCTAALNVTAILAVPLYVTICYSLLEVDHTTLTNNNVSRLTTYRSEQVLM